MKKVKGKTFDVAELRMLRWMSGVTKLDRMRNKRIAGTTKVGEISKKIRKVVRTYNEKGRRILWVCVVMDVLERRLKEDRIRGVDGQRQARLD